MNGYIKLHRQLLEWEWYEDKNCRLVFIHCLLVANYKDKLWRGTIIKRGSFISSLGKLSTAIGISTQQLRTVLVKLSKTGEIISESQGNNTLLILPNYSIYQDFSDFSYNEVTNYQQIDNKLPTNYQQITNK